MTNDAPEVIAKEQCEFFRENGYLYYGPLLSTEEQSELRGEIQRFIDGQYPQVNRQDLWPMEGEAPSPVGQERFLQLQTLWRLSETARKYAMHKKKSRIAAALLGTDRVRLLSDMVLYKPPGRGKSRSVFWHQDYVSHPNSIPDVTSWMPLDTVKRENGCMQFIPGSHKLGEIAPESAHNDEIYEKKGVDFSTAVHVEMESGDVVFHHGMTVHRSDANTTDNPRRVYINRYMHPDSVYRESDMSSARDWVAGSPFPEDTYPYVPT